MRDPKRIKRILKLIEKLWEQCPDMRLIQLLLGQLPFGAGFFTDDDVIEKCFKELSSDE